MNHHESICADLLLLKATGGSSVADAEIEGVADALSAMLPRPYTFGALEHALRTIMRKRAGAAIAVQIVAGGDGGFHVG
jgi:hypothetical protein